VPTAAGAIHYYLRILRTAEIRGSLYLVKDISMVAEVQGVMDKLGMTSTDPQYR
jgi:hypothetical protein